ncbi:YfiM family protein [bacterium]|nr:YfiM family protein [bacterium]
MEQVRIWREILKMEIHHICINTKQTNGTNNIEMLKRIIQIMLIFFSIFPLAADTQESKSIPDSSKVKKRTLYKAIAYEGAYYVTALFILQKTWYKDREIVPFHFYNDNKGYLQVDKFGHTYGSYLESYIAYKSLLNSGLTKNKALIYGGTLGFILQTPIEIMDGIHEGWGFSWGDMAANAIGSGLVIGQELLFNEQTMKYKFSYWESYYSAKANGFLGTTTLDRLLEDYNGHTYWLSIPVNRFVFKKQLPPWLNIAVGYGANGMYGEYSNISNYNGVEIPNTTRYRQYLLSLDIDWTKIETKSKFMKTVLQGMTFIKLPFPSLEYNSKGQFKVYWLYY